MTDPQDPRYRDPITRDSGVARDQSINRMWGWIAGIAVAVLIAFIIIAGWNGGNQTASNPPAPATTGSGPSASPPASAPAPAPAPKPATPPK